MLSDKEFCTNNVDNNKVHGPAPTLKYTANERSINFFNVHSSAVDCCLELKLRPAFVSFYVVLPKAPKVQFELLD